MPRSTRNASPGRIVFQFFLSTLPFLAILGYLLYKAIERGNAFAEDEVMFNLFDTTIVFLAFHVFWTFFAVYLLVFVPKRRYLLERYLRQGESTLGDVIVEDPAKKCMRCCATRKYGYAIYSHPTKTDPPVVVRKKVRVYQPYTRERIEILRLPERPLSGQAKIDIEIDLSKMRAERDTTLCSISAVSIVWALFTLAGAGFCVYQMGALPEELLMANENVELTRRILILVAGINPFFALAANGIRFLYYHNWMVHTGASMENEEAARTMKSNNWFGNDDAASFDGSDHIPYSILGEDRSYAGTIHSHSRSIVTKTEETQGVTVTSVEDDGSKVKSLPWTNV